MESLRHVNDVTVCWLRHGHGGTSHDVQRRVEGVAVVADKDNNNSDTLIALQTTSSGMTLYVCLNNTDLQSGNKERKKQQRERERERDKIR